MTLYDDFGYPCKELRVLPTGGQGNILCSFRGYLREIRFRQERNRELAPDCQFKLPAWEDLKIYAKDE